MTDRTNALYTSHMRSVADDLREEQVREMLKLAPAQRMELALRLGTTAVDIYMAANNVDRQTAVTILRRNGTYGRVPSKSHDES